MGHKFAEISFTPAVQAVQQAQGSRQNYLRMEAGEDFNHQIGVDEAAFISLRDSFYMASVSETNWPYVQHRGGPAGFLKVLDNKTLGFADYTGNRQYISTGNFVNNDRVALFFMDYPNQTRLKLLGRIRLVESDEVELLSAIEDNDYRARVERAFVIDVEAIDWNCPKHITPRYTLEEMKGRVTAKVNEQVEAKLEQRLSELAIKQQSDMVAMARVQKRLGEGALSLTISGIRQLTPQVRAYELRAISGADLPKVTPGSHIQLPVRLKGGRLIQRSYSICSNPSRRDIYEVAILANASILDGNIAENEQQSRQSSLSKSGSHAIHQTYRLGMQLHCTLPNNHFDVHQGKAPVVLIAGGIGITPIKALAQHFKAKDLPLRLHYAGRSLDDMAFSDRLKREFGEVISFYPASDNRRLSLRHALADAPDDAIFYVCGPQKMLAELNVLAAELGISAARIKSEGFGVSTLAGVKKSNQPITIHLQKSQQSIEVSKDETILDALLKHNIDTPFSCQSGSCKQCVVTVIEGKVEHLDGVLSDIERDQLQLFCPCVSRAKSSSLTLDL